MDKNFIIGEASEKLNIIIREINEKLINSEADYSNVLKTFNEKVQEIIGKQLLKISFVGQYSAGKSTMISALTGNRAIKIDADIATDKTTDYQWNNIILTDTPGLFTDRKDHDEITLRAIKESDLLVYCLTCDLFDNIILDNFVDLSYNKSYKNKMIVVINKMSMESGTYNDLVSGYTNTLEKSLLPYKFMDFSASFIDAADYIDSLDNKNKELLELSHFEDLINNLNKFIKEKGILGKLDTPIRLTLSTINDMIVDIEKREDKEFFQTLSRLEYVVRKNQESTTTKIKILINNLVIEILKQSNQIVNKIGEEQIDLDLEMRSIQNIIEKAVESKQKEITEILEQQSDLLNNEVKQVMESELTSYVLNSVEVGTIKLKNEVLTDFGDFLKNFNLVKDASNTVGGIIMQSANIYTTAGLGTAGQVAGSQLHNIVFSAGKFFGVKFQPWGAVNLAKNLGNVVKVAGPLLCVVGLGIEIASYFKSRENVKKLIDAKKEIYDQFLSTANGLENTFAENYEKYKNETYIKMLNQINGIKEKQLMDKKTSNIIADYLKEKKVDLEKMLDSIYN